MSILFKGNLEEGNYTLIKSTDGWVLKGEISYVGFNFADRPTGEWIPVSERLPAAHEVVILCGKYNMFCGYRNTDGEWYSITGDGWETDMDFPDSNKGDITVWMPLPEPYREEYELATEQMEHDTLYEQTYNSEDGSM